MTTDLDTGEHTAELVEMKGKPVVVARQAKPATVKNIRGRTLEVDVQAGGKVKAKAVKAKGLHTVTPLEIEEVLPSWSKTKKTSKKPKPVFPKVGSGQQKKPRRRPPPGFAPPRLPGRAR